MSHKTSEYEFARKIMKRERKEPNVYSTNRKIAMVKRIQKEFGTKGLKEFTHEFRKDLETL